jgi:hypothetical protein
MADMFLLILSRRKGVLPQYFDTYLCVSLSGSGPLTDRLAPKVRCRTQQDVSNFKHYTLAYVCFSGFGISILRAVTNDSI